MNDPDSMDCATQEITISPLLSLSPPRPKATKRSHPSIAGRLNTFRPQVALNTFLDHASGSSSEDDDDENETHQPSDNRQFDNKRRRSKRRKSRIARPRDSMPGFGKRRYGRIRTANGGFTARSGGAAGGSRHLDRGVSAATYYGKRVVGDDDDAGAVADTAATRALGVLEADMIGVAGHDVPVCLVHGAPCIVFACKKPGKNFRREFYKCAKRQRYEQCDFFRWVDDPPACASDAEDLTDDEQALAKEIPAIVDFDDDDENALDMLATDFFGHSEYRPGQKESIRRLLEGRSTLALMPTGGGKTLIYQAFAAIRPGLVVVVTPLISLMHDQLASLPKGLQGACLRSGQPLDVILATEHKIRSGEVKVLFISPERLFTARFRRLMGGRNAPHVSLVVVDEAHCVSQWSHNFRTAYLRIPTVLFGTAGARGRLFKEDPLVLALTATATKQTIRGICTSLRIRADHDCVRCDSVRNNLSLTLSKVEGTVDAKAFELVRRLKAEPFASLLGIAHIHNKSKEKEESEEHTGNDAKGERQAPSRKRQKTNKGGDDWIGWGSNLNVSKRIRAVKQQGGKHAGSLIVYVSKQKDCESLRNYLSSSTLHLRGKVGMYHAGMSQAERNKVQKQFEGGSIPILVATVAFGLGLNYSNVLGVVHFDMPSSLEVYSQEIGRAGRSGGVAFCHAFYSEYDGCRLLSRSHADGIDRSVVRQFLRKLVGNKFEFKSMTKHMQVYSMKCKDKDIDTSDESGSEKETEGDTDKDPDADDKVHVLSVTEYDLCRVLDIKYETAETICAIIETDMEGLRLLKSAHTKMKVKFFSQTPEALQKSTSRALKLQDKFVLDAIQRHGKQTNGQYELNLIHASLREDQVAGSLNRLQGGRHISFEPNERGLQVECVGKCYADLKRNLERWASLIHEKLVRIEKIRRSKAIAVVKTLSDADNMLTDEEQSKFIHASVAEYFSKDDDECDVEDKTPENGGKELTDEELKRVRRAALALSREEGHGSTRPQTARQIARIMHGINSAGFSAKHWWNCGHWGRYVEVDFEKTRSIAAQVLREQYMSARANTATK